MDINDNTNSRTKPPPLPENFRDSLNNAQEIFKTHKPNHFCLVLNSVKKVKNNYYYRRYGATYKAYSDINT